MRGVRRYIIIFVNMLPIYLKWKLIKVPILCNKLKIDFIKTRSTLLAKENKIIVIGANDGLSFDNLFQSLDPKKVSGLVIEPSKKYFSFLNKNLKDFNKIKFLNLAVTNNDGYYPLYQLNFKGLAKLPDWGKGLGSFSKENLLKFEQITEEDIELEVVQGMNFNNIVKRFSFYHIDYLQIDTEGFDAEIIKMINFNSFSTLLLKFEWVNLNSIEIKECKDKLMRQNFFITQVGGDLICYSKLLNPIFY